MSQGVRNKGPFPERDVQAPARRDGVRTIIEALRVRLKELRAMEDPKAAALASECEAALLEIEQKLDVIAGTKPALPF